MTGSQHRPRPATLKDIANAVGVDISTASKVVNGGGISVRPETRQAILDEATRLNYRPHALARNLRTRRTGALGILLPDLTNPVYATTIRGAVRRNRARRRLREAYRATRETAPTHTALVIIGRPAALREPFSALAAELRGALAAIPGPRP